ncbi:cytochrome b [Bienertia sinuspersici]
MMKKRSISMILMLGFLVVLTTIPQTTLAGRPLDYRPLSNIMFEGVGIDTNPLNCVPKHGECNFSTWCCGSCACAFYQDWRCHPQAGWDC